MSIQCKICLNQTIKLFSKKLLGKFDVNYYSCLHCNFLQTEDPYWLDEAYSSGAISALDTGIMHRNLLLRTRTRKILLKFFVSFTEFRALDFGGGEGIFVRMMRDLGFNFYRQDLYADNLYARFFDLNDLPKGTKFEILTAFEVFEHLSDPLAEIKKMLEYSDTILFSTELQPTVDKRELENWWYFVPETGQHISFYSKNSLSEIAELLNLNFYTDKRNLHIFSKKYFDDPFKIDEVPITLPYLLKRIGKRLNSKFQVKRKIVKTELPPSLRMKDFELVKKNLNNQE